MCHQEDFGGTLHEAVGVHAGVSSDLCSQSVHVEPFIPKRVPAAHDVVHELLVVVNEIAVAFE
jgi:hypothetical protein